jgi:hypothetical protein
MLARSAYLGAVGAAMVGWIWVLVVALEWVIGA